MRQNPHNPRLSSADKIKHLFFEAENSQTSGIGYSPFFFAEVRIDFNDVRTGFRSTVSLNKAIEICLIAPDWLWAEDMIRDIDSQKIKSSLPDAAFIGNLPDYIDANFMSQMEIQFIQYLLRSYKAKVYRNFELDVYSYSGESLSEFAARCLDLLNEKKQLELDTLHDVFNRKLEQIKQKYLNANASDNLELAKTDAQSRDIFLGYSERIADLFLQPELKLSTTINGSRLSENNTDLEERLACLELEAQHAIAAVWNSYKEKAQSVDEYILHPNLKDIHFVRSCILWIPARAT